MITLIEMTLLTLIWIALTGDAGWPNILMGVAVAGLMAYLGRSVLTPQRIGAQLRNRSLRVWLMKPLQVMRFVVIFFWEITKANVEVALTVLSPNFRNIKPGIIAVPLDVTTDAEITMFANMITLTPGTLSIDVSDDRSIIYVYAADVGDPEVKKREIKESLESLVHEVFG
jgi:multicomponent Na+:H+ antiporter subunit E